MKLSEKGIEKVENYSSVDLEIEGLEPDDFQDVVVLTVEEAKIVTNFFWRMAKEAYFSAEEADVLDFIEERIIQAEKGNEVE